MLAIPNRDRYTPWFLVLVFLLPIAIAYLFLLFGWYEGGATNKGQLVLHTSYQQLEQPNPVENHWQLIMLLPADCDQPCQARLTTLKQARLALGAEQHRVVPVIFTHPNSDPAWRAQLSDHDLFRQAEGSLALAQSLAEPALVVVDPWGQWVMAYPRVAGEAEQLQQGKDLLADLRKLLKLSRIG